VQEQFLFAPSLPLLLVAVLQDGVLMDSAEIKVSYLSVTARISNCVFDDKQFTQSRSMSFLIDTDSSSTRHDPYFTISIWQASTSVGVEGTTTSDQRRHLLQRQRLQQQSRQSSEDTYRKSTAYEMSLAPPWFHVMWCFSEIS